MKATPSRADVTITVNGTYHVTGVNVHTSAGIVWFNRTRRTVGQTLLGLSIEAVTSNAPSVTFETINASAGGVNMNCPQIDVAESCRQAAHIIYSPDSYYFEACSAALKFQTYLSQTFQTESGAWRSLRKRQTRWRLT